MKGQMVDVREGRAVIVGMKVAEDGEGLVIRLLNPLEHDEPVTLDLGRPLRSAYRVLPDERESVPLRLEGRTVSTVIAGRQPASLAVRW